MKIRKGTLKDIISAGNGYGYGDGDGYGYGDGNSTETGLEEIENS